MRGKDVFELHTEQKATLVVISHEELNCRRSERKKSHAHDRSDKDQIYALAKVASSLIRCLQSRDTILPT